MKANTKAKHCAKPVTARLRLVEGAETPQRPAAQPLTAEMKQALKAAAETEKARRQQESAPVAAASGDKLAYSVREAAKALGVSEWYIRDEIDRNMLAVSKARGRILIPRWELDRYIVDNLQAGPQGQPPSPDDSDPGQASRRR